MQADFAELLKWAKIHDPNAHDLLSKYTPAIWMTYREVVDHHDRIREVTTTDGTNSNTTMGLKEIRRYEHEGCVLVCEDWPDGSSMQTVTDVNAANFTAIEFYRRRGRGDSYTVYHENPARERLVYCDGRIEAQMVGAVVIIEPGGIFVGIANTDYHCVIIFEDGKVISKEG